MAEQTITIWFFLPVFWMNFATPLMCFGVASEVPPNLITSLIGFFFSQ
jgi:hypothetical protein